MQTEYKGYIIQDSERHGTRSKTGNLQVRKKHGEGWLALRHFPHDKTERGRKMAMLRALRYVDDHRLIGQRITMKKTSGYLLSLGIHEGMIGMVKHVRRSTSSKKPELSMQVQFVGRQLWIMEGEVIFPEGYEPAKREL